MSDKLSQKGFGKNFLILMKQLEETCCPNNIFNLFTEDTKSVDLLGWGTECSPLKANVKISSILGNTITIEDDGLYSAGGGITPTPPTNQIYTAGSTVTIGDDVDILYVDPSIVKPSLTIKLPAVPPVRGLVEIYFGGQIPSGEFVINLVDVIPNTGQDLLPTFSPFTVTSGESLVFRYRVDTNTWYTQQ